MKILFSISLLMVFVSSSANAFQVHDLYAMSAQNRAYYLGGIYDANLVLYSNNGERSECVEALGFKGFLTMISNFIVSLPTDKNSAQRKAYDKMNVATLSALLIDKRCQ